MGSLDTFKTWWGRQGRWIQHTLRAAVGVLVVWLLAWLLVPPVLHWQLEKQASDALGRAVTAERVRFRPWSLELEVLGLKIAGVEGGAEPQLELARLYVDAELQSLLRLAPVVDALELERPVVRLRHRGEGRFDIDDVLQRLAERPSDPNDPPARFALHNLRLSDGRFDLADDVAGARHRVDRLQLSVPFLSNLASQRTVKTEPHLAFELNGSAFDSRAATTPFAETHATEARFVIKDFDLADYLAYWPQALPWRPTAGALQADLRVFFEQQGERPVVRIGGELGLDGLRVVQVTGPGRTAEALAWQRLTVQIREARPLERQIHLSRLALEGPQLWLGRGKDGQTNVARALAQWPGAKSSPGAAATPAGPGWVATLDALALTGGSVRWRDEAVQPALDTAVEALEFQAQGLAFPVRAPMPFDVQARVRSASLALKGQASDTEAQAELVLRDAALQDWAPYVATALEPALAGRLAAELGLSWKAGEGADAGLRVTGRQIALTDLVLGPAKAPLAALRELRLADSSVAMNARQAQLGQVVLSRPQLRLERDREGRWMYERWFKAAAPSSAAAPAPSAATPPWKTGWTALEVSGAEVRWADAVPARPVALGLTALQFKAGPWRSDVAGRTPLNLALRVAAPRGEPGRLSVEGQLQWKPGAAAPDIGVQARVQASALPLHALEPYVSERLNLELLRADASYQGTLDVALQADGLRLAVDGNAALEEFRAHTLAPSEELLAWKSLNLRGFKLALAPRQPLKLQVAETALSDYYARIAIDENGRINLQDLVKPAPTAPGAAAAPAEPAGAPPELRFGPVALVNGRVAFSDRFIRPNYSANLSELTGKLSAFSNQPLQPGGAVELAELELLGRVEGTASLDLRGRINPLAQPLALDVKGRVRDLELPPLSPYTVKYAGHGIERGKLSVDVGYRIDPDGRLNASNQIVLNQLSFGERVPGSEAPNLPVRLAVALLADRNGVIDINLPISGSMNDPEFRVGPLIFKLIFNLIGKALTAPFALLANALGGAGDESGSVDFAPGSARLDGTARARLDGVAKALTDRPALRLTVVGRSDLEAERRGYQRERLLELVRAEKRRGQARSGAAVEADVAVSDTEYPALLKEVYRRADITKPRNLVGLAKDIPVAEMEALLMASVPVTADSLRELAIQRGIAIRDYLAARQLPTERLFTGAPQVGGEGAGPSAQLQLSAR